jgi:hypothetical protein
MIINTRTNRSRLFLAVWCVSLSLSTGLSMALDSPGAAQTSRNMGAVEENKANPISLLEQVQMPIVGQNAAFYLRREKIVEAGSLHWSPNNRSLPPEKVNVTGSALEAKKRKTDRADWDNLKQLGPGDDIRIVLKDGRVYRGKLQVLRDEEIVVSTGADDQTLARPSVSLLSSRRTSHRWRNALIGAGLGAGVTLPISYSQDPHAQTAVQDAACIALVGAAVGALISKGAWQDVYRAR